MPSLADRYLHRVVHLGADIAVLLGGYRQREETVGLLGAARIALHLADEPGQAVDKLRENAVLDLRNLLLGTKNLLLVFLQFGSDVALGVDECLFPDPFGRHLILVGVAHFDIVPEHVVETYFERRYSGGGAFSLLDAPQSIAAVCAERAEFVEFRVDSFGESRTFAKLDGGVGTHGAPDGVHKVRTVCHRPGNSAQFRRVTRCKRTPQGAARLQRVVQLACVARADPARPHLHHQPLQFPDSLQNFIRPLARGGIAEKVFHRVMTTPYFLKIEQREKNPVVEPPRPHRSRGVIEHIKQRHSLGR